jgi:methylamine dehydrogenase heavy chain
MSRRTARCLASFLALAFIGASAAASPPVPDGGIKVAVLPQPSPHWVLVYNLASLGSFSPASVTIFDGDSQRFLGMLTGGLGSSFAIAPDRSAFYMADTFYSRGSRGERTDVVTIYDAKTLLPNGEVVLPTKRQLTAQDNATSAVTPDGKLLLVANMTPATSATVVDISRRKVLGEIELTGCVEIIMSANRQFVSLCGDGSMMTTSFDDRGKATSQHRTRAPFFNPDKDPVYALPAVLGKMAYFLSYGGTIYPVDLSTDPATPGEPWSLLGADERKNDWKPGGMQALAAHEKSGRLYVLMHRGGEWSHRMPGIEVWVHDAKTHERVQTIKLEQMADAIMTTRDDAPLLVAVMTSIPPATLGYVHFYSAADGKLRGTVKDFPALAEHIYALP